MNEQEPAQAAPPPGRSPLTRRSVLRASAAASGMVVLGHRIPASAAAPGFPATGGLAGAGTGIESIGMGEDPPMATAAALDGNQVVASAIRPVRVVAPPIATRAEWLADESLRTTARSFAPIRKLVVHHTVTADDSDDWGREVREVYRYHIEGRDYADIAYNFLIDPTGRIWEGRWARAYGAGEVHDGEDSRGLGVVAAHTASFNTGSCGVAVLGDYSARLPTPAALESLVQLLAWKAGPRGIDPMASDPFTRFDGRTSTFPNLVGHRDLVATTCPGTPMHEWLPTLRAMVAARTRPGLVGYRVLTSDGTVTSFGGAGDHGSPRRAGVREVRAISSSLDPQGYWVLGADGGVFTYGRAGFYGSVPGLGVRTASVDLAASPTGRGYWVLGVDGGVFCFGDAAFHGSLGGVRLNGRAVKLRPTPTGDGYWLLGSDGGVFTFGDAAFHGSLGGLGVTTPTVDLAPTATGKGYWLLGADGGVFCFGDAEFHGSVPGLGVRWAAPAVAIAASPDGEGYHVLASDGGVFSFGDVPFFGSTAGSGRRPLGLAPAVQAAL